MIKVNQETIKSPVGWKGNGNIKSTVMGNEKVIIQIINKVRNHREAFTFHNNKCTNHGVVRKSSATCGRVLLNRGKVEIEEKRIIKLSHRL
jgi:hypothetical protein